MSAETVFTRRVNEFVGVLLFAAAVIWLIALTTYDTNDAVWLLNTGKDLPPNNFVGRVGAFISEVSFQLLGRSAFLLPILFLVVGWQYFWCYAVDAIYTKCIGLSLLFACCASLLSIGYGTFSSDLEAFYGGGVIGSAVARFLAEYFNRTGSLIVILTTFFLAVILSTQFSFGRFFQRLSVFAGEHASGSKEWIKEWWTDRQRARMREGVLKKHLAKTGSSSGRMDVIAKGQPPEELLRSREKRRERIDERKVSQDPAGETKVQGDEVLTADTGTQSGEPQEIRVEKPRNVKLPLIPDPSKALRQGRYTGPPVSLFDPPKQTQKFDERQLMDSARLLEEKCREFSVEGTVTQIHPGPVVTTFEFKPDAGIKYSKVTGLVDDLCLAMRAESILIERIPGRSTVGMQIPNAIRDEISLREQLVSEAYERSSSKLTVVLGKTIHGASVIADLATMPHLLIAGATGTGKSVALNAMLTSILFRASPDDVRLILIDPKRLELGMYEDIPHLLTPVVVDPKQANNALRWAVREMEDRYKHLAEQGVRNIDQYNRNIDRLQAEHDKQKNKKGNEDSLPVRLPFIVLAIDELADLMMVASKDVEESIQRLAQMARAVGIHLILATQRPSVDVITGVIKANLPARIAFRVSSKVDSRTILDSNGAEQLLGKGDMLFLPPSTSRRERLHGPYISEQESARLCSYLRKQGKPAYDSTITANEKPVDVPSFSEDELYDQAARIVVTNGQASISFLQRRLRIGFSRAARLVDMMEADGLVSAGDSKKPREILVKPDYFDAVDSHTR